MTRSDGLHERQARMRHEIDAKAGAKMCEDRDESLDIKLDDKHWTPDRTADESAEAEAKYIDLQNAHMELIMAEDTNGQYAEEKLRNRVVVTTNLAGIHLHGTRQIDVAPTLSSDDSPASL